MLRVLVISSLLEGNLELVFLMLSLHQNRCFSQMIVLLVVVVLSVVSISGQLRKVNLYWFSKCGVATQMHRKFRGCRSLVIK